ncbi:hypothetical protein SAMN06893096_102274 [Geodermatophilus pulveris]|uniref:Uncharacterized protein n=1 Tax=Geodermatophilus pulveris TaxID=1564159 RepID=A0A239C6A9_9ACTN|nr:hypothetical protein [Geodermatophilus pulveris]SNS15756.1 hypothetical protein SAMN06893096_102274 [Geodermatophilus pulveris]
MYVGVVHTIKDAEAWDRLAHGTGTPALPEGLELLATGRAAGSDRVICLWRAPSVAHLRAALDGMTGTFVVDDCFAVSGGPAPAAVG